MAMIDTIAATSVTAVSLMGGQDRALTILISTFSAANVCPHCPSRFLRHGQGQTLFHEAREVHPRFKDSRRPTLTGRLVGSLVLLVSWHFQPNDRRSNFIGWIFNGLGAAAISPFAAPRPTAQSLSCSWLSLDAYTLVSRRPSFWPTLLSRFPPPSKFMNLKGRHRSFLIAPAYFFWRKRAA